MQTKVLGRNVGNTGFGLLSFTRRWHEASGYPPDEQVFATMRAALASGCNFWNGGEFYGTPEHNSLTLLKKYYERYPEDVENVVLNIKGCLRPNYEPDGSAAFVRESVENCLRMLGGKSRIDMFECGRRDPDTPLAETMNALAELVREGKIGGVALSEVNANTIREASEIVEIVAVEIELSLWCREPLTNGITQICAEKAIPIIAYSPVGRGMLTGQFRSLEDLPQDDMRRRFPRFAPQNFDKNMKLVREVEKLAAKKGCTAAQLALGWVRTLSKGEGMPVIIPIPGTTSVERVKENAVEVELSGEEMKEIEAVLESCEVAGDRYGGPHMKYVNG